MKIFALVTSLIALTSTAMAADVGVSISVGQPGFYGRIDIGDFPQPRVIYPQPIIIERPPRYVEQAPVYLRVPPGHAKHWSKHCHKYHACDRQVYFVHDDWYTKEYVPHYRERRHDHDRDDDDRRDRRERRDRDDRDGHDGERGRPDKHWHGHDR